MQGKWPLVAGLVVLVAVVGGVTAVVRNNAARPKPMPQAAAPVPHPVDITLEGPVQARKVVNIPASTDGVITRFQADVGEDVFEGELLAQINNAKLDNVSQTAESGATRAQAHVADLENALIGARLEASRARSDETRTKSELERAQRLYTQQKALIDQGATPRLTFEKAEKEYNDYKADAENLARTASAAEDRVTSLTAELEVARKAAEAQAQKSDEAKADLGAGEVRSPVNGVVLARNGQAGGAVSHDLPDLFQIAVELNNLQVTVKPSADLLPRIKSGQAATVEIADAPGPVAGVVREVQGDRIVVDFTSPAATVKPGRPAKVKFHLLAAAIFPRPAESPLLARKSSHTPDSAPASLVHI
jgi:HlyD family secretion protein